ncbi:amidohydrolase family protein [Paraglaciecola sp. 20A4]|uniref:amidohydrolase family protein n=1 Tax=Paraglaciecola sp. 20A4 TaxID=2687288 RepID=UPI00140DBDC1|nr:amidohydrolase family protein [Paraglaciecola sp. 20A4]
MDIIDPHLHLFSLEQGQYDWLKPTNPPYWSDKNKINRNFSQQDLSLAPEQTLVGFVHIEAGFDNAHPWRELDWLEQDCSLPFKSVAGGDLTREDFPSLLSKLQTRSSLIGFRHILDEEANTLLSSAVFQQNLSLLAQHRLSFDAQFSLQDECATQALCNILDTLPQLRVIINHGGWPPAAKKNKAWQQWYRQLSKLAQYPNVAIKLSGWEMPNRTYTPDDLLLCLTACLQTMGDKRVMLASNFPLTLFRCSYAELWQTYAQKLGLSESLKTLLFCDNSLFWYRFKD